LSDWKSKGILNEFGSTVWRWSSSSKGSGVEGPTEDAGDVLEEEKVPKNSNGAWYVVERLRRKNTDVLAWV
jgi:hypothetical protein